MRTPALTCTAAAAAAMILILGVGLSGCAALSRPDMTTTTPLASCDELLPGNMAQDLFGRTSEVVQLQDKEPDAVDPLVDEMVTDGIACGGSRDDTVMMDGAVVVGQLAMDEKQWTSTRAGFIAAGYDDLDDIVEGWVYVSKPSDDPSIGSGFAWRGGVLYYVQNPLLLALLPAFASETAGDAPL